MRHRVSKYKLNRTSSHRKAMMNNMALALFKHEQISTTLIKAKNLRPFAEKIITLAKKGTVHARRLAYKAVPNKTLVKEVFKVGEKYKPPGQSEIV